MAAVVTALALAPALSHGQELRAGEQAPSPTVSPTAAPGRIEDFDLDELLDLRVEVTAASGRKQSLLEAPATISLLSREDIRASAARNVPDLLRHIPGLQLYQVAPGIFLVSLRGMGGLQDNNVIVLLNGIAINDKATGAVDWAGIPVSVDQIERIEVVRGPVSTIYGANAYTGVISITSVHSTDHLELRGSAGLATGFKSGATLEEGSVAASDRNGAFAWNLSAMGQRDGLFRQPAGGSAAAGDQPPNSQAAVSEGGGAHLTFAPTSKVSVVAQAFAAQDKQSGLDHLVVTPTDNLHQQLHGGLELSLHNLDGLLESARVWTLARRSTLESETTTAATAFSLASSRSTYFEGGAQTRLHLPLDLALDLGAEANQTNVNAPYVVPEENGKWRAGYAGTAALELHLGRGWLASLGSRVDVNALSRTQYSYRGSIHYTGDKFSGRLTAAHGFRNPTYIEIAGRLTDPSLNVILLEGNRNLLPQSITSVELAVLAVPVRKLVIAPVLYALQLDRIITEDFSSVVQKTYSNFQSSSSTHVDLVGAELESWYEVSKAFIPRMSFAALIWPSDHILGSATVGVPENNSTVTAAAGVRGALFDRRLLYGLGADIATARTYHTRAGVPPAILAAQIPARTRLEGTAHCRLFGTPLFAWLRAQTTLPSHYVDSPFPDAVIVGSSAMVGLEFRPE